MSCCICLDLAISCASFAFCCACLCFVTACSLLLQRPTPHFKPFTTTRSHHHYSLTPISLINAALHCAGAVIHWHWPGRALASRAASDCWRNSRRRTRGRGRGSSFMHYSPARCRSKFACLRRRPPFSFLPMVHLHICSSHLHSRRLQAHSLQLRILDNDVQQPHNRRARNHTQLRCSQQRSSRRGGCRHHGALLRIVQHFNVPITSPPRLLILHRFITRLACMLCASRPNLQRWDGLSLSPLSQRPSPSLPA